MLRWVFAALLIFWAGCASAQTQTGVIPGYMSPAGQGGCPSTNACFVPYGSSVPTGPSAVTYAAPTTGTVTTTATLVAVPGAKVTKICNTTASSGGNIWLNPSGGTAVVGSGDEAQAGGGCVTYTGAVVNANGNIITGVSDSGSATYTVTKGS